MRPYRILKLEEVIFSIAVLLLSF